MFRSIFSTVKKIHSAIGILGKYSLKNSQQVNKFLIPNELKQFSSYTIKNPIISNLKATTPLLNTVNIHNNSLLKVEPQSNQLQCRSLTKFSLQKGKRKTVKAVLKRFKRLDWGIWIRTRAGRHKKLFKKSAALKRRLKQHVFVNSTQSWLLDSMVTNYWRKPKYYIDDPYEQYHKREDYFATRKKPVEFKKQN